MCDYCEEEKTIVSDWSFDAPRAWVDEEGLNIDDDSGHIGCVEIRYCPMCGRDLGTPRDPLDGGDREYLSGLGRELAGQDGDGVAAPRLWTVRHMSWEPCWRGFAGRNSLYSHAGKLGLDDAMDLYGIDGAAFDGDYERMDAVVAESKGECWAVPERLTVRTVSGAVFPTKREAQDYIAANRHNLAEEPHTYAITSQSRQLARLLGIVERTDWRAE